MASKQPKRPVPFGKCIYPSTIFQNYLEYNALTEYNALMENWRYELKDGKSTAVVEICTNCGKAPQAPEWDQCFGCGKTGAEAKRIWVPARECSEYGIHEPIGLRWKKWEE